MSTKSELFQAMDAEAQRQRRPAETREAAFARFTETPRGARLYDEYSQAPGSAVPRAAAEPQKRLMSATEQNALSGHRGEGRGASQGESQADG